MATTWTSTPELSIIILFERFWPVELLVIGGWTYTESNIKSHQKLLFESQKYIIRQYMQSGYSALSYFSLPNLGVFL